MIDDSDNEAIRYFCPIFQERYPLRLFLSETRYPAFHCILFIDCLKNMDQQDPQAFYQ